MPLTDYSGWDVSRALLECSRLDRRAELLSTTTKTTSEVAVMTIRNLDTVYTPKKVQKVPEYLSLPIVTSQQHTIMAKDVDVFSTQVLSTQLCSAQVFSTQVFSTKY